MLVGMFNHKLNHIILKEAKLDLKLPCHKLSKSDIIKLSKK